MNREEALIFLKSKISYEDAVNFKYDQENFNLQRFRKFLDDYGVEYQKLKFFHVGGSKGKGTISTFIAEYLDELSKEVGLFTSPYIVDIRECFWVNGEMIKERDFCRAVQRMAEYFDDSPDLGITYFEILTALVLEYFVDQGVEYVVMEVGMGGRLDSTNVIMPEVAVINTIEKEHQQVLGESFEEIVIEKLGIAKEGVPLVIGCQNEEVEAILENCLKGKEKVFWARDFEKISSDYKYDGFNKAVEKNLVVILLALREVMGEVKDECVQKVLDGFSMLGRMEVVEFEGQKVILDMAHTTESIKNLLESLKDHFGDRKYVFLMAFLQDKKVEEILRIIEGYAKCFVFTEVENERAMSLDEISEIAEKLNVEYFCELDKKKALDLAIQKNGKDDVLVIAGSHYLIGEILPKLSFPA